MILFTCMVGVSRELFSEVGVRLEIPYTSLKMFIVC